MKDNSIKEMSAIDAMEQLSNIMNDKGRTIHIGGTDYEIHALKMGTQWLIADESLKIQRNEDSSFSDIIKQFAKSIPSVVRCLTLAVLNDKDKIGNEEEYKKVYDTIMWDSNRKEWMDILVHVMEMLSLDCFFDITNALAIQREMALGRKMKKEELKKSLAEPNGGK